MNLSLFQESSDKQEKGSPCYIQDGHFDVRRIHTPQYSKEIESVKKKLYGFDLKGYNENELLAHWLCEYGVTGWSGIYDQDDNELEYSKRNARSIFLNPEMWLSLNALLIQHASHYNNYLYDSVTDDIEEIKKELSYRQEVGYGDSEKQIFDLYKFSNKLDEFYDKKPKLTEKQTSLLNSFYRLSNEREYNEQAPRSIKTKDIRYYLEYNGVMYPDDLFIHAISEIDREFIEIKIAELRKKAK